MNKNIGKNENDAHGIHILVDKKILYFQEIIQKTVINVQKNKNLDILGISDVNTCIHNLDTISEKILVLSKIKLTEGENAIIAALQSINNDLSAVMKLYGTQSLEDLLVVCFGNKYSITNNPDEESKFDLLKKYFHPTSYKIVNTGSTSSASSIGVTAKHEKNVISDSNGGSNNLSCMDTSLTSKQFIMKVYGVKVNIYNKNPSVHIVVYGVVDDVILRFLNNPYIYSLKQYVVDHVPNDSEFHNTAFIKYMESLSLKDYFVNPTSSEIYKKYMGCITQQKLLLHKSLPHIVKEFIGSDIFSKRNMLIHLLIRSTISCENEYIAYLLYDILSNDSNGTIDTHEQTVLFDSLPWSIKKDFREAMKKTIEYTNNLSNYDINKIPLEQQICMLKTTDSVKEKAMMKLKEVKAKTEDSGSKARQYLDGLLKIPFNGYIKEPIMDTMDTIRAEFIELRDNLPVKWKDSIPFKNKYTSIEIAKHVCNIKKENDTEVTVDISLDFLENDTRTKIVKYILAMNRILQKIGIPKMGVVGKKAILCSELKSCVAECYKNGVISLPQIQEVFSINAVYSGSGVGSLSTTTQVANIDTNFNKITDYIMNVKTVLDNAVYGHEKAKKQIERIIGQWINGTQSGYCFGFEGPPGVGKTSLAKTGLSNCLKDETGESRPFAMIAMGGDSNGSTLHGHNYTYVGSTWGSIVQILIDKKCLNPIIFIDELDKISKTEHGREIIGILTHLLDPTQNDCFQDKYFSGIDLDLSKALFILSYNDVSVVDKILLDRIHRIKFGNLTLEEKMVVAKNHILPDIYVKMGLFDMINISDEVITFIVDNYTCEAGVRKLKEVLFEIIGEINIDILKNKNYDYDYPIHITVDDITTKYCKDRQEVSIKKISPLSYVGIVNGLWANSQGLGGTLPIQTHFFPCDRFLELKLTGMQGDVMKESMNVAFTLAWGLTKPDVQQSVREKYNKEQKYGIHIHCPEGGVPKDGPSAGSAITTVIYSLLNNRVIKNYFAMTGEISLDSSITAIGGLDAKILGGIKAGVTDFIYPEENHRDFCTFMENYMSNSVVENIKFHRVKCISEVFDLVFE